MQSTVLNHENQKANPTWKQISLHFTVSGKQEKGGFGFGFFKV